MLDAALEVSMVRLRSGDLPLLDSASSVQFAGVGGTGPSALNSALGRLVGGDTIGSVERDILCDLDDGGGPGGGPGSCMPGVHLDVEDPRERDVDGVLMAPVDAALRDAGGRCEPSSSDDGASTDMGTGRRIPFSRGISGDA